MPLEPGIGDAVVLFATGAAIVSAPAYARQLGLDAELALLGAPVGTLLVPLTAPPIAWAMTDVDLAIGMAAFAARLGTVVGLPLLLSLLVAFGFGVMNGVGDRLLAEPAWVLQATLAACVASAGLNLATAAVLLPCGARIAATANMLSGFRSMALYLVVLPTTADAHVALFFGLYQIPFYVGPLVMAPLYRLLLRNRARPPS